MKKDPNKYPKGWNYARVQGVIEHFDRQSDDDAVAEAQAAWENSRVRMMAITVELVSQVESLLAERSGKTEKGEKKSRRVA